MRTFKIIKREAYKQPSVIFPQSLIPAIEVGLVALPIFIHKKTRSPRNVSDFAEVWVGLFRGVEA